jgi:uncharacterized membrane protein
VGGTVPRMAERSSRRDWIALGLGTFITLAGVMHFANPTFFDDIVPPWLPPSERFWTYVSGVAELIVGPMLLVPRTRRIGALAAIGLFVVVYPANLYMVWDWRDRPAGEQFISWARLPFQFLFIWLAWRVYRRESSTRAATPAPAQGVA